MSTEILEVALNYIILQHPTEPTNEFEFRRDFTYSFRDKHTKDNIRRDRKWRLDDSRQALMYLKQNDSMSEWFFFWDERKVKCDYYNLLKEWLEVDRILLADTDTNNL
jgi:hypothetical protein